MTKNGTNAILYLDGSQVASTAMTDTTFYGVSPAVAIARDGKTAVGFFPGSLEDVAVYNTALERDPRPPAHYQAAFVAAGAWTPPSTSYQNGELSLLAYGGRPLGGGSAITAPTNYTLTYDTQSDWLTAGAATRTLGAVAGTSAPTAAAGPYSWWAAQQVILRPIYDTSLAQSTPDGAAGYDEQNRLTALNGYTYSYDPVGNLVSASGQGETAISTFNSANELATRTKPATLRHTAVGNGYGLVGTTMSINLPNGAHEGDLLLAHVASSGVASAGAIDPDQTGWTLLSDVTQTVHSKVYWRWATATRTLRLLVHICRR